MFFYERVLASTAPAFDLLFSGNRIAHIGKHFAMHQTGYVVACSEATDLLGLVFLHPSFQIVGHADIDRARGAAENVDPKLLHNFYDQIAAVTAFPRNDKLSLFSLSTHYRVAVAKQ